jgi:hypothetical protein
MYGYADGRCMRTEIKRAAIVVKVMQDEGEKEMTQL